MASTPEGLVKKQVRKILDANGVYNRQPVTGGYGHSGQLDFYCSLPPHGKFLGIETKSIKSSHGVTALQQREIDSILASGGLALVINEDNIHQLQEVIDHEKAQHKRG
jgi:hypothetical protein